MSNEKHKVLLPVNIAATGFYVPENIVTNLDLERDAGIESNWIEKACKIKRRRISSETDNCSDMGYLASCNALEKSMISLDEIDLIILASATPDFSTPATASIIQNKLGIKNAVAFDIEVACMGFIWAINIGCQFITTNVYQTILVIASEVTSRVVNYEDKRTYILLGDGAGAAVLKKSDKGKGVLSYYFKSDTSRWDYATVLAGGSKYPEYYKDKDIGKYMFTMNGKGIYKFGVNVINEIINELLKRANVTIDEVTLIIPHQANGRLLETAMKKAGISSEKFYINIEEYGNTSAATVAIALAEAEQKGRIKDGNLVMLVGFGAGLSWGGMLLKW